jgi:hypothetical protein
LCAIWVRPHGSADAVGPMPERSGSSGDGRVVVDAPQHPLLASIDAVDLRFSSTAPQESGRVPLQRRGATHDRQSGGGRGQKKTGRHAPSGGSHRPPKERWRRRTEPTLLQCGTPIGFGDPDASIDAIDPAPQLQSSDPPPPPIELPPSSHEPESWTPKSRSSMSLPASGAAAALSVQSCAPSA